VFSSLPLIEDQLYEQALSYVAYAPNKSLPDLNLTPRSLEFQSSKSYILCTKLVELDLFSSVQMFAEHHILLMCIHS
jgi:hypothetical protein